MEYLTAAQIAKRLGITQSTWRTDVLRGYAPKPARKLSRVNLWRLEDVIAHEEKRSHAVTIEPPGDSGVMTSAEIAAAAGLSVNTWRSYVRKGYAPRPSRKVGGVSVWPREEAEKWIDSRKR